MHDVRFQTGEIHTGVAAIFAMVRLLASVRPYVPLEIGRRTAGVAALGALERLSTRVHEPDVLPQRMGIRRSVAALRALVRLLSSVHPHVSLEQ